MERVDIIDRLSTIHNKSHTFQTGAGIDAVELQTCQTSIRLFVKFHKDPSIPDFDVAIGIKMTTLLVGLSIVISGIEENFSTGATWTCLTRWTPEVILSEEDDVISGQADLFPGSRRLFIESDILRRIALIDGRVELVFGEAEVSHKQFVGEFNRPLLKVVVELTNCPASRRM